jgi:hypothetical protein
MLSLAVRACNMRSVLGEGKLSSSARALFAIFVLAALLSGLAGSSRAAQTLDDVPQLKCGDILPKDDGAPTRKTFIMLTWLAGYRDAIAALGSVDQRFQIVGKTDMSKLAPQVLAICEVHPELTVGEVTTDVFAALLNLLPGKQIDLALPPK